MTTSNAPDDAHGMDPNSFRHTFDDRTVSDGYDHQGSTEHLDESADEAALRTLMLEAVSSLHGSPDALEHLRRAVPLRRQRRRQALVGAAAVVLLAGMAVPALLRVTSSGNAGDTKAASVAVSHNSAPGEDGHTNAWGNSGSSAGQPTPGPGQATKHQLPTTGGTDGPSNLPATPSAGTDTPAPPCSTAQLGQGTSQADAPDSGGKVYGWFRLANVSDSPCTVAAGGVVQAVAQGSADPSKIQIVDHTDGDAAVGLPSAPTGGPVVLSPGQQYEVAFAWVPATSDGTGGCQATPTPSPTTPTPTTTTTDPGSSDTSSTVSGTTGSDTNSVSTQLGEDAPSSPTAGSVALNHTPAPGAPVVDGPVIEGACAGTVYTTPVIPEPTGTPTS